MSNDISKTVSTKAPHKQPKGTLIIIGGHEDKGDESPILKEVCRRANRNRNLVIVTVATQLPEETARDYTTTFKRLGASHVHVIDIRAREDAYDDKRVDLCKNADVIFFTGGDQLRITSQIGDSPVFRCMRDIYQNGGHYRGNVSGSCCYDCNDAYRRSER